MPKKFFYDIFGLNTVRNITRNTQIRPQSVARTSIYDTLHNFVIITSINEENVYEGSGVGDLESEITFFFLLGTAGALLKDKTTKNSILGTAL